MIHGLWNTFLYQPLLNALAFLVSIIPGADLGIAIIVLTIIVKLVLFPLSQKALENQAAMNLLTPELEKVKKSGASKEEQAVLTFELYKKHKVNPLSGCLVMIPTLIIIIALYRVFYSGISFDPKLLYSFVHVPQHVNMIFLGIVNISKKSVVLAILTAASQYLQAYFMPQPNLSSSENSLQNSLAKSMNMQMKYVLPFFIGFIAYIGSGVVALYFITSNIFAVGQQIYVRKTEKKRLSKEVGVLTTEIENEKR
jgi:YidC/Oxa1 family membrane protein insertase